MTTIELMANEASAAWSTVYTGVNPASHGMRFQVTAAFSVEQIGLRHSGGGSGYTQLAIYDSPSTFLVPWFTPAASGADGWQMTLLPTPVTLLPGVTYTIAGYIPNAMFYVRRAVPPARAAAPVPFLWDDHMGVWAAGGPTYPFNAEDGEMFGLNLIGTLTPDSGGGGITPGELDTGLATWLSTDGSVQLHESDGIPWWLYEYLVSLRPWLGEASDWSYKLPVPINWIAGTLMQRYITDIDTITSYVGKTAEWISPLPAPSRNNTIDERLTRVEAKIDALTLKVDQILAPPPPLGWTLVAEQAFDTWLYLPVPANYYLVHFDYTGSADVINTPVGIEYIPRIAWWTPHDGTGGRDRRFLDLRDTYLDDRGAMMPGLFLHSPKAGSGTIQAFTT